MPVGTGLPTHTESPDSILHFFTLQLPVYFDSCLNLKSLFPFFYLFLFFLSFFFETGFQCIVLAGLERSMLYKSIWPQKL